jgi:hypothetical protein
MAKILKCPSCQGVMDVTSVSPGSTVRCPSCGQTAKVPSGNTSVRTKTVSAPIPPSAPAPAPRERGTRVQQRRPSGTQPSQAPPKSNSGLFVGLGVGAVAVIAVIAFFTMKETPQEPPLKVTQTGPREPVVFKPNLPPQSDKPIVLGSGSSGKEEPKTTPVAAKAETVDNANWDAIMRDLRPGGGFDHLDRPEGVAFQKVKGFGKAAYPKLIKYIDDEDPSIAIGAVAALNALTGRDSALPKGVTKAKIKAEWEEWLKTAGDAK